MSNKIAIIVKLALAEDIGQKDVSASLLPNKIITASIVTHDKAVICGIEYAEQAFLQVNDKIILNWKVADGAEVAPNKTICLLIGGARSIISAERTALNFLQTLSATATQVRYLVDKISHTKTLILDTRKTIPNLRHAQKYAVKCGGGVNHRMGLYDCVMLKENHIKVLGSVNKAIHLAKQNYPKLPLIVEVENLKQLAKMLDIDGIERILCDNFSISNLKLALKMTKGRLPLEASGGIDENNIVDYANSGVDFISVGSLTKNIYAPDLSLCFN